MDLLMKPWGISCFILLSFYLVFFRHSIPYLSVMESLKIRKRSIDVIVNCITPTSHTAIKLTGVCNGCHLGSYLRPLVTQVIPNKKHSHELYTTERKIKILHTWKKAERFKLCMEHTELINCMNCRRIFRSSSAPENPFISTIGA